MHTHLAHKMAKKVIIVDEAHNLVSFLQELHTKLLWQHKVHYPRNCWSREDFKKWVDEKDPSGVDALREELNRERPRYSLIRTSETYHGEWMDVLKMVPFDVRGEAPFLWPGKGVKLIFLSATFNHKDLERIGLADRRYVFLSSGSPIPPERRPVVLCDVAPVSHSNLRVASLKLLDWLPSLGEPGRGLVHSTYGQAKLLKELSRSHPLRDRLLFHTEKDKRARLAEWLESDDKIFVACGLTEGLDLAEDKCRWQVIGKVAWPSLNDPLIAEWAKRDPEAYVWETLKQLIQASGRVCRGPEDYGVTYVFDSTVRRLLKQAEKANLLPEWWLSSIVVA
jgi:Rad3-related DNA helicase